ncbi:MAG: flagellar basal-body MS-ring/collar protein FliF [Gammaproteobacteria bacterium]
MAIVQTESVDGFQRLPMLRQVGLMIGLAASVALGVSIVLWSQTPNYSLLYGNLSSRDAGDVIEALQKSGIPFKVDESSGAVMVPNNKLHSAKMELAKDGLPAANSMGFELLEKEQSFGSSQFMEKARYQRAMEGELASTISSMRNIESSRVHLAIPKRTVFMREKSKPTASVMVKLYSGRALDEEQIAAIMHLVSSSVPYLEPNNITVADQHGNLLNNGFEERGHGATSNQFSYNRKLEDLYASKILSLLEPMVGVGKVRASVSAELDFTEIEKTEETYNPDLPALRSEQLSENRSLAANGGVGGVPGALVNQPPEGGQLQGQANGADGDASNAKNSSKSTVRNFELDKTTSHTKLASGVIRKLSVAVVLDYKKTINAAGETGQEAWEKAQIDQFTSLIKESVGFSAQRGDTVNVVTSAFLPPPELEPVPEQTLLEKPWIWDVAKQAGGVIGLILLVFGVLKPTLKSLATHTVAQNADGSLALAHAGSQGEGIKNGEDQLSLSDQSGGAGAENSGTAQLAHKTDSYQNGLETVKNMVTEDPKRAAQLMKNWVSEDG